MPVRRVELGELMLGTRDPQTGVKWILPPGRGLQGWGSPASTASPTQRARGDGAWVGDAFLASRQLLLTGSMQARRGDYEAAERAQDQLIEAASLAPSLMTVHETGRSRSCMAQRRGEVVWDTITDEFAVWSIDLVAKDPRKAGAVLSGSTPLPSTTGGLAVPFTVPFTIDAVTVTGQVSLTNPGNIVGPVKLRIDGPVQGPVVTHVSSGRSLVFASSVVLGPGEWIEVDMERREVLANGQASRNGWVTQRGWSGFQPGDNTWAFTAVAYNPGSLLTVSATPTWQ